MAKKKNKNILITKASGDVAAFSVEKLKRSLCRAGATPLIADQISKKVASRLYEGVSTKKIYRWAFSLLRQRSRPLAAKYHLKRGIMELGPSGFPFEKFIGELLKHKGYEVETGKVVAGQCVLHEIDVIATKENQHFMIECKYHNRPGTVCDVKIPLYIYARFRDVETSFLKVPGYEEKFREGWVVTNTRFTNDAIQYGTCAGLKLVGWDFPNGNSLRSMIDASGLYPITCLTSLTSNEKQLLLEKKIVLCKELCKNEKVLRNIGVSAERIKAICAESEAISKHLTKL